MGNVTFVYEELNEASVYYRCRVPAKALNDAGHEARLTTRFYIGDDGRFHSSQVMPASDAYVLRRLSDYNNGVRADIVCAREHGQRVFFDLDDAIWHIPKWNPAHDVITSSEIAAWVETANVCDGLIVTTSTLRDYALAGGVNVPIHVIPNTIPRSEYQHGMEHQPLRLAWVGVPEFRQPDFEEIEMAVRDVLEASDATVSKVQFCHVGLVVQSLPLTLQRRDCNVQSWVRPEDLPMIVSKFDAVIIPAIDIPFNRARSIASALPCMATGVPFLASKLPEYKRAFEQGAGYVVENTYDAWVAGLRIMTLPEYEEARRNIATGGLALARAYEPATIVADYATVLFA